MSFYLQEAIKYANYSLLAYGKTEFPTNLKYEWVDGLPVEDIQCLVIYEQDKIIFSFRGTDDFRKWMIDASIKFKTLNNGIKVHSGFYKTVNSIWPKLITIINKTKLPIYTTGHSKGAAEARQFTYRLATERNILVKTSYTYGEPRSFNKNGANDYNSLNIPTFRIIDQEDLVCRIPWRLGLYQHVSNELFIDGWDNLLWNEPWYAHLPSDIYGMIKELLRRKTALIADHSIDEYIKKLTNINNSNL